MSKDGQKPVSKYHEAAHLPPLPRLLARQGKHRHITDIHDDTDLQSQVPRLERKETLCALCRPSKRIVGANAEGCRTSLICHRALQHGELRLALEADNGVTRDFISRLFSDEDKASPESDKSDEVRVKTEVKEEELKDSEKEREMIKEEVKRKVLQRLVEIKNTKKPERGKKRKKLDKMQELELRLAEKMRHY